MNSESQYLAYAFKNLGAYHRLYYYMKKHHLHGRQDRVHNSEDTCSQQFCFSHKARSVAQNCN